MRFQERQTELHLGVECGNCGRRELLLLGSWQTSLVLAWKVHQNLFGSGSAQQKLCYWEVWFHQILVQQKDIVLHDVVVETEIVFF